MDSICKDGCNFCEIGVHVEMHMYTMKDERAQGTIIPTRPAAMLSCIFSGLSLEMEARTGTRTYIV